MRKFIAAAALLSVAAVLGVGLAGAKSHHNVENAMFISHMSSPVR
ncbi:hypothetical protein ABH926_005790 [Catenulispora sp. GP43]